MSTVAKLHQGSNTFHNVHYIINMVYGSVVKDNYANWIYSVIGHEVWKQNLQTLNFVRLHSLMLCICPEYLRW